MAGAELAAYSIVVGLLEGLYFAFMALGLNLVFGVVRMVNIAHGDLVVLGGYLAFVLFASMKVSGLASLIISFAAFFVLGVALYYVLVPKLQDSSDPEMFSFIAFFGISMIIEAAATLIFGEYPVSLPYSAVLGGSLILFGYGVPRVFLVMSAVSTAMLAITYYYLQLTGLGRSTRAMMQNREQALALGVNTKVATLFAFAYGIALAGMAGGVCPRFLRRRSAPTPPYISAVPVSNT